MLYLLSGSCPHSSPDPFGATLPPGEGMDVFVHSGISSCRGEKRLFSSGKSENHTDFRRASKARPYING